MTRTASRRTRVLAAVSAVLVAGGALVGCSAHPGAAAIATYTAADGSTRTVTITEEEIQTAATELAQIEGLQAPSILQRLVDLALLDEVVPEYGIVITDADARQALETELGPGPYSQVSVDVARCLLTDNAVGGLDAASLEALRADYEAVLGTIDVDVSPRYSDKEWLIAPAPVAFG